MNQTEKNTDLIKALERMHRWRMAFFSLAILIAGIVIGASFMTILAKNRFRPGPHSPEIAAERMLQELNRRLHLTPWQNEAIRPMFIKHMKKLRQIRMDVRPKIEEQLARMNEQVSALLDDSQKQQWKRDFQRLQNQFHQPRRGRGRRQRWRGGPPGPNDYPGKPMALPSGPDVDGPNR